MTSRSALGGNPSTKSIVNAYSTGGVAPTSALAFGRQALSGALAANTFATVLSGTGKGSIPLLTCYAMDSTSRTLRMRVTIDGVVVFNPTASQAVTQFGAGIYAAGNPPGPNYFIQGEPIRYNSSFLIEVMSSRAESGVGSDQIAIGYIHHGA